MTREATVTGPSAASQQLKPLSLSKSKVWRFFGFAVDGSGEIVDITRVVVRLCERRVPYSGNTTNLFYHLQTNHPQEHKEVVLLSVYRLLPENVDRLVFLHDNM